MSHALLGGFFGGALPIAAVVILLWCGRRLLGDNSER